MATIDATGKRSIHAQLTAATVDTVTFGDNEPNAVEVVNVSGSDAIYFTVDGTSPQIEGDDTIVLPAVGAVVVPVTTSSLTVRLISAGTPKYSVRGV